MSEKPVGSDQNIIDQTQCWVKNIIIGHNFCPFAKRELERESIRYSVNRTTDLESALQAMIDECGHLDDNDDTETTLLIFTEGFKDFENYLDLVELGEKLIADQDYEGIVQVASFHPDYCFADSGENDAANFTNRSPYPMLHLLREDSISEAVEEWTERSLDVEQIPVRNIETLRKLGADILASQLQACYREGSN